MSEYGTLPGLKCLGQGHTQAGLHLVEMVPVELEERFVCVCCLEEEGCEAALGVCRVLEEMEDPTVGFRRRHLA